VQVFAEGGSGAVGRRAGPQVGGGSRDCHRARVGQSAGDPGLGAEAVVMDGLDPAGDGCVVREFTGWTNAWEGSPDETSPSIRTYLPRLRERSRRFVRRCGPAGWRPGRMWSP
jgi:hypothetical protein